MENPRKKIHRFFADFETKITDPALVHQMHKVLRFHTGETLMLVHDGKEVAATIAEIDAKHVELKLSEPQVVKAEPKRRITAYIAMFKKEPFEWMLEKLTEIGVSAIVPLETERTVRFPWKPERYAMIIKEAAEQSGRGMLPMLHEPVTFEKALSFAHENHKNFLFDIAAETVTAPQAAETNLGMFIGPEGGFTENEIATAKKANCRIVGVGPLTLRAETAAIVAAYELIK